MVRIIFRLDVGLSQVKDEAR